MQHSIYHNSWKTLGVGVHGEGACGVINSFTASTLIAVGDIIHNNEQLQNVPRINVIPPQT